MLLKISRPKRNEASKRPDVETGSKLELGFRSYMNKEACEEDSAVNGNDRGVSMDSFALPSPGAD